MSAQLAPLPSHRRHWYLNVIGVVPLHVPSVVVRVWPSAGVPVTVGGAVFVGLSCADAWPLVAVPKIAPIASAVSASSTIRASARPLLFGVISSPLLLFWVWRPGPRTSPKANRNPINNP